MQQEILLHECLKGVFLVSKKMMNTWQDAVDCAISECVDYKARPAKVRIAEEGKLKAAVIGYLCQQDKNTETANQIYADAINRAVSKKRPDSQAPISAVLFSCIGWIAAIVNVISFFAAGFNLFFILFLLLSLSVARYGDAQLKKAQLSKKAMEQWTARSEKGDSQELIVALTEMEKIFAKVKR